METGAGEGNEGGTWKVTGIWKVGNPKNTA